ncbi:hypothetical protein ACDH70_00890 [Xanthomonas axonopodis pv. poinsettiicola]|uniref:hypothetical protein n=1 Tax=Xanthomonas TaxID=338 RepID=UPI001E5C001F|nr:hypothetical protein [Xanthomonas codiaei]MCC8536607.1 hypothetical protein [Xanthomonas codiaei]
MTLSWHFWRRAMLGSALFTFREGLPVAAGELAFLGIEGTTPDLGLRRHVAAINAFSTGSLVILAAVA